MTSAVLTKNDEARLAGLIRQLERALRTGDASTAPSVVQSFAPAEDDPIFAPALAKMIMLGMSRQAEAGKEICLEPFLAVFPGLAHDETIMPELMSTEARMRTSYGQPVHRDEYRERFPEHFQRFCEAEQGGTEQGGSETLMPSQPGGSTAMFADARSSTQPPAPPTPELVSSGSLPPEPPPSVTDAQRRTFVPDFNSYQLVRPIGKGQFGEVWQAVAPGGVDVAVKVVPWPKAHRLSQMELRALEVVKRVRHPFLIQMHAYWAMQDQVVVVMELCEGSLEQRAEECRAAGEEGIPPEELVRYTRQAAEALDHLHNVNVVHRDIKPANILLAAGHAKLGDFGVARLFEREAPDTRSTLVGTPHFMAPEVWQSAVCPASDQYSLAATYLDLRLGLPQATLGDLMAGNPGMQEVLGKLPERERKVLVKALDKDPEKRFESCRAMAEALAASVAPEVEAVPEPSPGKRLLLAAAVLFLIVLVGGVIGLSGQADYFREYFFPTPPKVLPIGFKDVFQAAPGAQTVNIGGTLFYDRVFLKQVAGDGALPDNVRLEFVLVPITRTLGDPQPFYMMADKVTNDAFGAFAEENPDLEGDGWKEYATSGGPVVAQENPRLPVMNVTVDEAHHFAQWIHPTARLPSMREWQKASGLLDCHQLQGEGVAGTRVDCESHPQGPYRGMWSEDRQGEIALNLDQPQPVGTASADVSLFGCRDMAGNGFELTSDVLHRGSDTTVPVADPEFLRTHVKLCGWSYEKAAPLTYEDLIGRPMPFHYLEPDHEGAAPDTWPLNRESDVGFRIVIPIPTQLGAG